MSFFFFILLQGKKGNGNGDYKRDEADEDLSFGRTFLKKFSVILAKSSLSQNQMKNHQI